MRRRIYIDPEGDLSDNTASPYLYDVERDIDEPLGICRTGALYNESLWAEYEAARRRASELRRRVCEALINEPLDDVERSLHTRAKALLDGGYNRDEMDRIKDAAMANAATRSKP